MKRRPLPYGNRFPPIKYFQPSFLNIWHVLFFLYFIFLHVCVCNNVQWSGINLFGVNNALKRNTTYYLFRVYLFCSQIISFSSILILMVITRVRHQWLQTKEDKVMHEIIEFTYGFGYAINLSLCINLLVYIYTGWNDKIVVLKKTTLQLYFKTFIEKSIQVTWLCSKADIYRVER